MSELLNVDYDNIYNLWLNPDCENKKQNENWNIEAMTGYKPISTFYEDFSIADNFGVKAIKDTYNRAFNEWKDDYKMLTELVMVLNWKIWRWHEYNKEFAQLYNELWETIDNYACENLKGEELAYFYKITD